MFGYKRLSDSKLIEEIRNGNEEVLVNMYKNNYTMVRNFILKNNGNEDDIEDVLQDSVIAVWRNVNKDNFNLTAKMSTYLMSIVKNTWFKKLKKRQRFTVVDESHKEKISQEETSTDHLDHSIIREMVAAMDDTCKKLLSYFYFDGYDNKTIAEKLGFANTNTVKSKKYQCFKRLQSSVIERFSKDDFLNT